MDWELYYQHLISGYLPMILVLLLYFYCLHKKGKKQKLAHVILVFVFCFYLFGILSMTGIWWFRPFSPIFVFVPFIDMVKGPVDTVLNFLLFIPLGLFLPVLYQRFEYLKKVAVTGFLISFSVEVIQMYDCGATDINDLITNTMGTCLGYYCYLLLRKIIPTTWIKALQMEERYFDYEVTFYWTVSLLIMTTIQGNIYHALF